MDELHALDKKLQAAVHEKESAEKEFKAQKNLVQQLLKEKDNTILQLNAKLKSDCDQVKDHYKGRLEQLETQLAESEQHKEQSIAVRMQDLHQKEAIFNENITKYQRDLKEAQVCIKAMQL